MSTITMSNTWRERLRRGRRRASRATVGLLAAGAVFGSAAGFKVFFVAAHPSAAEVATIAVRVANQRDAAGQFAADFVAAVLTTPAAKQASLQRFITLPEPHTSSAAPASASIPAVINTPKVWSVVPAGSAGEVDMYSATVVVQQRPYASAESVRAFYRVPVGMWQFQPRAMAWPVPVSDPGPGANIKTGYDHPLAPTSPVYAVVNGFIAAYLTATTGLDRYVVAGSWITPIGGYHNAVITTAATDTDVPAVAVPGDQTHVLATVTAQTAQFATIDFTFPLTIENSGGTWMIADIDFMPRLASATDADLVGPHREK